MKFEWYLRLPKVWQEVVDQTLHFAAGFMISAVIGHWFSIGVAIGREIVQNWGDEDNDYVDMSTDILVWSFGAVVASLLF